MADSVRCACGAKFSFKDLSGNPRTACPICRAAVEVTFASVEAEPSKRSDQPSRKTPKQIPVSESAAPTARAAAKPLPLEIVKDWIPPKNLRNHDGTKSSTPRRFPWGPPPQIGELVSADSNVEESGAPSFVTLYLVASGIAVATYIMLITGILIPAKGDLNILRVIAAGLGLFLGGWWLFWKWPQPPRCTYVGIDGAAHLIGKWGSEKLVSAQILVFREATGLFVSKKQFYMNPFSHRTYFRFDWHRNVGEAPLLYVSGMHTRKNDLPDPDHIYHFAIRIEEAWNRHLMTKLNEERTSGRTLSFPCRKNFWSQALPNLFNLDDIQEIRLSPTDLQLVNGDRIESVPYRDLNGMQLNQGVLMLSLFGPKWSRRQGKLRMLYQDIGNAQAFLYYLSIAEANMR